MNATYEKLKPRGLSYRESEVVSLVSRGLANKEVAAQLFITEKTVKFHLTNIYKKLSLKSRAQLIVMVVGQSSEPVPAKAIPVSSHERVSGDPGFDSGNLPIGGSALDQ